MSSRGGVGGDVPTLTAHERFKSRARLRFWVALAVAGAIHLLAFWWGPALHYDSSYNSTSGEMMQALRLVTPLTPQAVRIQRPAPPLGAAVVERVQPPVPRAPRRHRPKLVGTPVPPQVPASLIESAEHLSYSPPPVEVPPLPTPAPAPPAPKSELGRFRQVNALMEKPELVNRAHVRRALQREYPRSLQRAGVGGSVIVWFWIDEEGKVEKYEIRGSSGHLALDAAAERVIPEMKFRPAKERGEKVPVVVTMPIRFEAE